MDSTGNTKGMYIRFDPNKIVLPPIFGGPAPHHHATPLAGSSSSSSKRKRDTTSRPGVRFNNFEKVLQRAAQNELDYAAKPENDCAIAKDRIIAFDNRDELMKALRDCFKESHDINFAASYRTHNDSVTHKQRIQTVTHEIWKATGYRFTSPAYERLDIRRDCGARQDEGHKTKPSKISQTQRTSSNGVVLAKARYPCRSGLLISSRDEGHPDTAFVVVRMHHHFPHEAYYDHTLPPEMTQSIWEKMEIPSKDGPGHFPSPALPPPCRPTPQEGSSQSDTSDDGSDRVSDEDDGGAFDTPRDPDHAMHELGGEYLPPSTPKASPALTEEAYQNRMRQHIANIRDFCDGLEYQLPFNDFRLLEVLEIEGAQFLKLVHHCLELEGRLKATHAADSNEGAPTTHGHHTVAAIESSRS
ncbi:hypothetical protein FPV67DRAFT_1650940 [Lyophyllum atratum]|nr:hypothetical protein FPV67DRAFT_1650940 [Lyophyllum atratum]